MSAEKKLLKPWWAEPRCALCEMLHKGIRAEPECFESYRKAVRTGKWKCKWRSFAREDNAKR